MKGLIRFDSRGDIMFVLQLGLRNGNNSDKKIFCDRCVFDLSRQNLVSGKLLLVDAIMAERDFRIGKDLRPWFEDISPFLKNSARLTEDDALTTRTITRHRIHVERTIGKIKQYHICNRKIP